MFNPKLTIKILPLFVLTLLSFTPIWAQTATATLNGVVQDENGANVPGVSVTIVNPNTGLRRTVETGDEGAFTLPLLPPGTYSVTVRRDGFTPVEVRDVVLNVGDVKSFEVQLKVGSIDAAVQVTPEASLINTSPAVSTTVDRTFVGNLPLNGRSFQSLILLTPGIVATQSDASRPGEFSVNGQRQNANYFTVDGVSANTGVNAGGTDPSQFSQQAGGAIPGTTALGTTASLVSIDALEEFKIQTSTYSAEFGRQPGAQVQLVTRSGNNQFHGTGFEYLRNDALDAQNWFNTIFRQQNPLFTKAKLRQNQFGGTFSGPVMLPRFGEGGKPYWNGKNKTFFFFSYEGQRLLLPVIAATQKVPSLRLRQAAAPALQPFLNAFPLPTGPETTTATQCDPSSDPSCSPVTGTKYSGAAPFAGGWSSPSSVDAYSLRVDHTVSDKLNLFGRYSETPSSSLSRFLSSLQGTISRARTLTLGAALSMTPRLHNDFRFNYTSNRGQQNFSMDNFGGAVPITLSQLALGYSGPGPKQGTISFRLPGTTFTRQLGDNVDNSTRQFNIVDNVFWIKGAHQLKFGVDWRRLNPTYGPTAFGSYIEFDSEASLRTSTADFLQFSAFKGARPVYDNYSAYAQDTWKPSPRLTVDLGLRWDMNPAPHDANGLRPVVVTGISGTNVSNVNIAPPSAPFYKTSKTAFAPRVGAAYQLNPTSGRETVLRGGFGVYYDLGSGPGSSLFGGYPFISSFSSFSASQRQFPISSGLVQPPAFLPVPTQLPIQQNFNALDPNLRLPYTLEWSAALQQSLGKEQTISVSYVAAAGRRLLSKQVLNQRNPLTGLRLNPNIRDIRYFTNGPTSDYNSLQVQYQRRLSRGFQALVNYTWSHAIDEVSNEVLANVLTRGNADFDVRHNLSAALTYDFPKFRGAGSSGRFVRALANGWSLDSVFFARTGQPIDLYAGDTFWDGHFVTIRPDVVSGVPFWIKDANAPGGQRINPAAFQVPPSNGDFNFLRQGTLGRNVVRQPGMYQLNMAIRRQFRFGERLNLQLKAEAFNVLNKPLFSFYNTNVSDETFGMAGNILSNNFGGLNSLYQIGGPRSIQLSIRLSF